MYRFSEAEIAANAALIRLNAERGSELDELQKQTNIWVDELKKIIIQKATEAMENDERLEG